MGPVQTARCRELLILLRKMTQAIDQHSKYLNKTFGLTGPQLIILQELACGELALSELATKVSLSRGTVTEIIQRLEKKDLVIKRGSDRDKRLVLVILSEKCKNMLDVAPPPLQEAFTEAYTQLEEWEQLMILSAMNRVVCMISDTKKSAALV